LNGAGIESIQGKWDEMFGEKQEEERSETREELKVKKRRKKSDEMPETEIASIAPIDEKPVLK
jgi:hypothetical protein